LKQLRQNTISNWNLNDHWRTLRALKASFEAKRASKSQIQLSCVFTITYTGLYSSKNNCVFYLTCLFVSLALRLHFAEACGPSRKEDRKKFSHALITSGARLVASLVFLAMVAWALGCGGGGTSSVPPPPPSISVSIVSPGSSVVLGNTLSFTATVQNATDTTVAWSVNGVPGGNATAGTISAAGVYTAPPDLPSPASVQVTATSHQDPTKSANASVTITSDLNLSLLPSVAGVELGARQGSKQQSPAADIQILRCAGAFLVQRARSTAER
jgi:hypothetical protein